MDRKQPKVLLKPAVYNSLEISGLAYCLMSLRIDVSVEQIHKMPARQTLLAACQYWSSKRSRRCRRPLQMQVLSQARLFHRHDRVIHLYDARVVVKGTSIYSLIQCILRGTFGMGPILTV